MGGIRNYARYVIQRMRVEGAPRAFVLGCRAQRVTVLSQQFRAFNLIWALFQQGHLKEGDRVGVVGGGIGGLTVAAAAMLKGCKIVLTEEREVLMPLQRRNTTRLLHPNIYEWPLKGAEIDSTDFPVMNWVADTAGQVVDALDKEWEGLEAKYHPEVHRHVRVGELEAKGPDGRLILKGDHWESDECDVVVIAVGFGVEPPVHGIALNTYWENDKLEQSVRGPAVPKRFLISGLGDGGCIDVLRLKYSNFNHVRFAATVARLQSLERYKRRLIEIDLRMPQDHQAEYLRDEYRSLSLPPDLAEQLGTLRSDTYVALNGSDPAPLSPRACILHRVAIWSLVMTGRLVYHPGRIDTGAIETRTAPTGIKYMVPLPGVGGKTEFHEIILRHGPRPCLDLFPAIVKGYAGIADNPAKDRTRRKLYPEGFYPPRAAPAPVTEAGPSPSLAHTLQADVGFADVARPPMAIDASIGTAGAVVRAQPGSGAAPPQIMATAEIELLMRTLQTETRAQNYPAASEAARQLDALMAQTDPGCPPAVRYAANRALYDYELYARERTLAGGGSYDLERLGALIRRLENDAP
jgi:hypothetical protein